MIDTIVKTDKRPDFSRIESKSGYGSLLKLEQVLRGYIDLVPKPVPEKLQHDYANAVMTLCELEAYLKKRES